MDILSALVWGFGATIVLTTILRGAQAFGYTRIDLPYILGSVVTADRDLAKVYGYLMHLVNGWVFAFVYVAVLETADGFDLLLGVLTGLVHASFVLVVALPVIPVFHPRMSSEDWGPEPTRQLEPPGNLGLNYGTSTPLITLVAHLVYGAILGGFYRF